jgi:flagellar basal-body rod protein FlgF
MQSGLYVNISGQVALERRLATIANNVANAGTVGYRSEELKFDTVLSLVSGTPTAYSTPGESFISERSGGLNKTGDPLDVAVQGKGWLAIQTPAGIAYTRDGRMQFLESGELQTLNGYPVLDAGNAPILLDPAAGTPKIARDGMITQNGRNFGALGLFTIEPAKGFTRFENSGIIPANAGSPVVSFASDGFVQGFVEESNVNPVTEMTDLIMVTRAFDGLQTSIEESSSSLKRAIQVLGGA